MFWSNPGSFLFNDDHLLPFLIFWFYFFNRQSEFGGFFLGQSWKGINFSQDIWQLREILAQLNPEPKLNIKK